MADDAADSLGLAPWRSPLAKSLHLHRGQPQSRYVQLATVTPQGYPANRTVVFRGFVEGSNCLKFVTDSRSRKIAELRHCDHAEVCWYFEKSREQFRIHGVITALDHANPHPLWHQAWHDLSPAGRSQFAYPEPGQPRLESSAFDLPPTDAQSPLSTFVVLLLEPLWVDHLQLRGDPQNRWHYRLDGLQWYRRALNP